MKSIQVKLLVCISILGLVFSTPVRAQVAGATLSGVITDAQGGAVPNAKVTVTNTGTAITAETTTNSAGAYSVPNLNPSDYEVRVSAPGFSTAVSKVTLTVGAKQEMNIALTVGEVSQTVEVTTAAPQIELQSSTLSGNVQAAEIRELPLNGRDWASLATLEPGVSSVRTHLDLLHVGVGGRGFGMQLTIGGSRPTQNTYRLDGAIVNDYSNAGPGSVLGENLGVDAIQEFTVLTSNYSAEYGFTAGGVINAVTRSGTNTFHGSAFDFLRNDKFDANDFFSNVSNLPKAPLRQNQFGASGGWRVFKDRLFLFGDYEGIRQVKGIPRTNDITISDAVRGGSVVNLTTGAILPTIAINSNIPKFLPLYPNATAGAAGCVPLLATQFSAPGVLGGCNPDVAKYLYTAQQRTMENFYTTRGDYKISDKDSFDATYLHDYSHLTGTQALAVNLQSIESWRQAIILEETHAFSSTFVNTFRTAFNRTISFGGDTPTAVNPLAADPSLGMGPGLFSPGITLTASQVTNLTPGDKYGASVQHFWQNMFEFFDDAFVTRGNHGLKIGFSALVIQSNVYSPLAGGNGSGTFSAAGVYPDPIKEPGLIPDPTSNTTTATPAEAGCYKGSGAVTNGNNFDQTCGALVNFLTNNATAGAPPVRQSEIIKHYIRQQVFGGYFQDDWRIRPSLTLNLGLRYEMATSPTEAKGNLENMPSIFTALPCSPLDARASSIPLGGFCPNPADPLGPLVHYNFKRNPTLRNFEPRIGFAWDPSHHGKMAIRGGFGIFDALPLPYEIVLNSTQAAPYRSTLPTVGPGFNFSPPPGDFPYNILADSLALPSATTTSRVFNYIDSNIKRNYIYQYNLNIQYQITPTLTLLVGYAGSRGIHNPFQADSANTVKGTKSPAGFYYWPGCFAANSNTTAGQTACKALGPGFTWDGNLTKAQQLPLLLNPTVAGIRDTMWQSRSFYNALQIKVDQRTTHGLQIGGSFTWSKSIDDSSGGGSGDNFLLDYTTEPWYDLSLNKGLSEFDIRRNLVIHALWNVPDPKVGGSFGEHVLGGWQLGAIVSLSDGVPSYPNIAADMLGEVIGTVNSPNVVAGCSPQHLVDPNYRHSLNYVNGNCLGLVPMTAANASVCDQRLGAGICSNIRGNLGRNTIVGPGLINSDFSVFKNNYVRKISETFNAQFRAEFFNVMNHTNFAPSPNLNTFSATGVRNTVYGQLTSTQVPNRQIQLALKLIW